MVSSLRKPEIIRKRETANILGVEEKNAMKDEPGC